MNKKKISKKFLISKGFVLMKTNLEFYFKNGIALVFDYNSIIVAGLIKGNVVYTDPIIALETEDDLYKYYKESTGENLINDKKLDQSLFDEMYKKHQLWLEGDIVNGEKANFSSKDLSEISFTAPINLKNAILQNVTIQNAVLNDSNFEGTDFSLSHIINCDLTKSNFSNSVFKGCNLYKTTMRNANLENTNFKKFDNILSLQIGTENIIIPVYTKINSTDFKGTIYENSLPQLE